MFKRSFPLLLIGSIALSAAPAPAQPGEAGSLAELRSLDRRVATIGHRLAVASLDLCHERQWLPGFAVHDLSQYGRDYREAAIRSFGLDWGPGVLALAQGGPAERAGLLPDDVLVAADGAALPSGPPPERRSFERAEQVIEALEAAFADGSAELDLLRGGERRALSVGSEQGCASRFQVLPSRSLNAHADGRWVQVTSAIAEYVADDDELAAVLAHEFAHNLLRHRVRLNAAGVRRGFLGNFGRNARLIRETEAEADRLSVYLLERAGYDPEAAVRFWSRFGRRGLNIFGSPTHPNWRRRIALFEAEIARIRAERAAGRVPRPDLPMAGAEAAPAR